MTKTRLTRLGSAKPYVRWINLRACPEDQASLSRARAGMTDRKSNQSDGGFTASAPVAASAPARSPLTSPLASPSIRCSQGPVCRAPSRLGPSDFVGLDRPRQTERKPGIGSTPKTDSFCCNRARRAQVLGGNCILPNCTAGRQRLNVRCKQRSPGKNRLTPMR
jgi:hypothetical protein